MGRLRRLWTSKSEQIGEDLTLQMRFSWNDASWWSYSGDPLCLIQINCFISTDSHRLASCQWYHHEIQLSNFIGKRPRISSPNAWPLMPLAFPMKSAAFKNKLCVYLAWGLQAEEEFWSPESGAKRNSFLFANVWETSSNSLAFSVLISFGDAHLKWVTFYPEMNLKLRISTVLN